MIGETKQGYKREGKESKGGGRGAQLLKFLEEALWA